MPVVGVFEFVTEESPTQSFILGFLLMFLGRSFALHKSKYNDKDQQNDIKYYITAKLHSASIPHMSCLSISLVIII